MAATRLRQTFKYPSEDEHSQGSRDEMDEEEQESLITNLTTKSQTSNTTYATIFTILPLTLLPLFTYQFFRTSASIRLLCLLSMTSLLASSFTMFFMSNDTDARQRLDQRQRQLHRATMSAPPHAGFVFELGRKLYDKLDDLRMELDVDGPLIKALPVLNGVMAALLAFAAWLVKGRNGMEVMWIYLLLPSAMFGMVWVARKSIVDEQRELRELRGLKYGYKGA